MSYERKVERAHPALIAMILDDSGSMSTNMTGTSDARYQWVERYSGIILKELLARCVEVSGEKPTVKPRYYLDVIKYGSSVETWQNGAEGNEEPQGGQPVRRAAAAAGHRARPGQQSQSAGAR